MILFTTQNDGPCGNPVAVVVWVNKEHIVMAKVPIGQACLVWGHWLMCNIVIYFLLINPFFYLDIGADKQHWTWNLVPTRWASVVYVGQYLSITGHKRGEAYAHQWTTFGLLKWCNGNLVLKIFSIIIRYVPIISSTVSFSTKK